MPRILTRNTAMFKRRGSSALTRANSSTMSSNSSLPKYPVMPWYAAAGLEDTNQGSTTSTASSSPSISRQRSSLSSGAPSRRNSMMDDIVFSEYDSDCLEERNDGWGQFVDTAEAEAELIRSSKILSKRYSLR